MSEHSINSIRDLSREVNRSEGAIRKWMRRPDWRFGRARWSLEAVDEIKLWMRQNLRDDPGRYLKQSRAEKEMRLAAVDPIVAAPGRMMNASQIMGHESWRDFYGEIFNELTVKDFDSLARGFNSVIKDVMAEKLQGEGARGVPDEAPQSFYDQLLQRFTDEDFHKLNCGLEVCAIELLNEKFGPAPQWIKRLPAQAQELARHMHAVDRETRLPSGRMRGNRNRPDNNKKKKVMARAVAVNQ